MPKARSRFDNPQKWSKLMEEIYTEHVHDPVMARSDRDSANDLRPLGIPFQKIRKDILKYGRADFGFGYDDGEYNISADDKVLLYCFINMRGHYWSTFLNLWLEKKRLKSAFSDCNVFFVDIGCGPGTAGLAYLELFKNTACTYLGVDSSEFMRKKCRKLLNVVKAESEISEKIKIKTTRNWNSIPNQIQNNSVIIFNFSYFFASNSLITDSIESLSNTINKVHNKASNIRVFISYTNISKLDLNSKYYTFQRKIGIQGANDSFKKSLQNKAVKYYSRRNSLDLKQEDFVREFFELI